MEPILLTQRIICPDRVWEFPVVFEPSSWYRGPYPTHVRVEGDVPQDILEGLISYAALFGWRWDAGARKFYPSE